LKIFWKFKKNVLKNILPKAVPQASVAHVIPFAPKHQIKVLMFLCHDIVEGTIAQYCDLLIETMNGGLSSMFNPCPIFMPSLH
jgi:hypothetical protein